MLFIGYFLGRYIPGVDQHIEQVIIVVVFLSLLPGIIGWLRARRAAARRTTVAPAELHEETAMAFTLPALPYAYDALEPHIDAQTMEIHHGKHHQAYVNNLNAAIEKAPELAGKSLDDLMRGINTVPEAVRTAVRNNGGGHWNHSLFWQSWARARAASRPASWPTRSRARSAISQSSRSSSRPPATGRFGSGWAWLVNDGGKLSITSTPNQDNPLMEGKNGDPRPRRLGARVLPEVPEQAAGLHHGVVERRELGRGRRALSADSDPSESGSTSRRCSG